METTPTMRRPFRHRASRALAMAAILIASPLFAQRDLRDIPEPDIEKELAAFETAPELEVSLFAADPLVTKPIQMNFDAEGKLWIVSSPLYPHLRPGDLPEDRVLVIEDTDGDGRADRSTVFAEDLLMPTGIEPGDGGAYVANSTEVLFLKDTDGDGRADYRRAVLSGFGTEDTHHLIHTFRWGHDGSLYFNQSIYIHSHVETPHGIRRMDGGGVWRFRPETLELEAFVYGMCNGWGHHFDRWGQSFGADGAGFDGVHYFLPGATLPHSPRGDPVLPGLNPGSPKYCGGEIISGRHFPEDWRGSFVTNDFRAHRVVRFTIIDDGAGYAARQMPDVLRSTHVAFRPVDVKMGPDGALYIADWYNPIIQHGEVDFRDPRRNRTNGRIWRLTVKDRPVLERPRLTGRPIPELLERLEEPEGWTRHFARRVLAERDPDAVESGVREWLESLDAGDPRREEHALEALWVHQTVRRPRPELLEELLGARDPRVRAAAVRVLGDWIPTVRSPMALLAARVADEHPRVRLEAVRALARIEDPRAAEVATVVLDRPMDRFLDYALSLTLRELRAVWLPALQAGESDFENNSRRLEYALSAAGSAELAGRMREMLEEGRLERDREGAIVELLARIGGPRELEMALDWAGRKAAADPAQAARVLEALAESAERRRAAPEKRSQLDGLLDAESLLVRRLACRLAAAWGEDPLRRRLQDIASSPAEPLALRAAAMESLARLGGEASRNRLAKLAREGEDAEVRQRAVAALATIDPSVAAGIAADLLAVDGNAGDPSALFEAFLDLKDGPEMLAATLSERKISERIARAGIRAVRGRPGTGERLLAVLTEAGGISLEPRRYEGEERARLLEDIASNGDPARGETVFRREDLRCLGCHAIGGSGGQVGPDLSSIGTSAQLDYLLDSLLEPEKAVKENYHGVTAVTDRGQVLTGILVRRSEDSLVIRTADDVEVTVAAKSVVELAEGKSIMPAGLVDPLARSELADLVLFLAHLGRPGAYSVGRERFARTWRVLEEAPAGLASLTPEEIGARLASPDLSWRPAYSRVSGALPLAELGGGTSLIVKCFLEATSAGAVRIELAGIEGAGWWLDGRTLGAGRRKEIELAAGRHELVLLVAESSRTPGAGLHLELLDVEGSPARARIIGGK